MTSDSASRVTRSSRSLQRALLLFAACLALAGVLGAEEPAAPGRTAEPARPDASADAAASATSEGPDRPQAAAEPEAVATQPAGAPDEKPRAVGPTPDRFEPTEKVRADFDVSFPVDI
jgi:hypothetical protein